MAETATVIVPSASRDAALITEAVIMADSAGSAAGAPTPLARASPPRPPLNQIYAVPAPIRTFPLPTFYPNNPISLLHLVYAWLNQVFRPPPREPSVIHIGVWDPDTRSVHVKGPASIRALWEQGFFGKGSLSRSEPTWLKRELARRGSPEGKTVSEARTELRREERRLAKWERAKAELEAIESQRLAEAATHAAAAESIEVNGVVSDLVDDTSLALPDSPETPVEKPSPGVTVAETAAQTAVNGGTKPRSQLNGTLRDRNEQPKAPVGPAELLALPNSLPKPMCRASTSLPARKAPVGPTELLLLPNSLADLVSNGVKSHFALVNGTRSLTRPDLAVAETDDQASSASDSHDHANGVPESPAQSTRASAPAGGKPAGNLVSTVLQPHGTANGTVSPASMTSSEDATPDGKEPGPLKRRKSVRFSPTVESTTFLHSDPPSPSRLAGASSKSAIPALPTGITALEPAAPSTAPSSSVPTSSAPQGGLDEPAASAEIENKEHFQLAPEEAFFLVFALGALRVTDPVTGSPIPTEHLLSLFRAHSYFPPRPLDSAAAAPLGPDDPFLVHYAVYHHFRSLGWVPRHGIKFGVDWILYQRGPVFDHSEFGIMVVPAFSDPAWEGQREHAELRKSWSWLMGVNRVLSHVLKSLVLVYVEIPPPAVFEEEMRQGGIAAALKRYTIREVMVRRFSVNRNR